MSPALAKGLHPIIAEPGAPQSPLPEPSRIEAFSSSSTRELRLENAFNGETLRFFYRGDGADQAGLNVVLAPSGSDGEKALVHDHPRASETFRIDVALRCRCWARHHAAETAGLVTSRQQRLLDSLTGYRWQRHGN